MGLFDLFKKTKLPLDVVIAADKGDPRAKAQLEKAFDKGMTSEEHNELRWKAYAMPANKGDANAQYWLGFLYSVINRDADRAVYWYEEAAKQGNTEAMKDLAHGYSEYVNESNLDYGPVPLGFNEKMQYYWLKTAADLGDAEAIENLRIFFPGK